MKRLSMLLVLVCLFVFGCSTVQERPSVTTHPNKPYPKNLAPSAMLSPIELGEKAPDLSLGTKYTFRQGNVITKQWTMLTWTIKDRLTWQGKDAYLIDTAVGLDGQGAHQYIIWDRNLNMMAVTDINGKLINAFDPCIKLFSFPMKVGSSYGFVYDYWNGGKKTVGLTEKVEVTNKELVSVPAGLYDSFVIKRVTGTIIESHYYAPTLGFPVKWRWTQGLDHQNPGEFATELVKVEKEKR